MVVTCDTTTTSAGASTVTFSVQDSADNSTFADVVVSAAIPKATLVAGYQLVLPMPRKLRQYCRVYYTVAVANLTAGAFSAQLVSGFQQNTPKPDLASIA